MQVAISICPLVAEAIIILLSCKGAEAIRGSGSDVFREYVKAVLNYRVAVESCDLTRC